MDYLQTIALSAFICVAASKIGYNNVTSKHAWVEEFSHTLCARPFLPDR